MITEYNKLKKTFARKSWWENFPKKLFESLEHIYITFWPWPLTCLRHFFLLESMLSLVLNSQLKFLKQKPKLWVCAIYLCRDSVLWFSLWLWLPNFASKLIAATHFLFNAHIPTLMSNSQFEAVFFNWMNKIFVYLTLDLVISNQS